MSILDGSPLRLYPTESTEESFPDIVELRGIRIGIDRLVALKLYDLQVPLVVVYAADPSGLVEQAILALAAEKLNSPSAGEPTLAPETLIAQLKAAGVDPRTGAGGFVPGFEPESWSRGDDPTDAHFYDCVRRLMTYLGQPIDDFRDLEKVAKDHSWTRETIKETMQGMGLED